MPRTRNVRGLAAAAAALIIALAAAALSCVLGLAAAAAAQESAAQEVPAPVPEGEYWQQQADYEIKVTLDTQGHTLTGKERITYTNNSSDTLSIFYLHLYANAFREKTSPLIRDFLQGTYRFLVGLPESMRGWIDVTELTVDDAPVEFTVDGTILSSAFPEPLFPGGKTTIGVTFKLKIMKRLGRMGYSGDQYDLAQWYPKMVVYDKNGWHPDQYRMGEFYGEFGTFDVHITLPEKFVIAATGMPIEGDPGWKKNPLRRGGPPDASGGHPGTRESGGAPAQAGGSPPGTGPASDSTGARAEAMKTVHFRAKDVHDFAWCANPSFVVQDTLYNNYHIMSFFKPWNRAWVDTTLAQGVRAMQWLEKVVGPYPYPQVSIVDCQAHGGMEYPMLAMDGYVDEGLVLHELAHMYFYGALANDERAEAWLDEGFAQYCTFWYTENHYGPFGKRDERPFPYSLFREHRMWDGIAKPIVKLHRTDFADRISTPVHEFKNGFDTMPYTGAPLFLRALRYTVGDEAFEKIFRAYYARWLFKHVDEDAFRSVCEEVSGMDLKDLFKQWLHTTKDCDYKLSRFTVKSAEKGYRANLKIERKGELIMPLTLAFRLANGNTVTERIDGTPRSIEQSFSFDDKPVSAAINPDNEILDIYQLDDFSPRRKSLTLLDVPFNKFYPLDAFSLRLLPIGYYNDIDGGKAGLRLRGSYDNYYDKFTLQGLYGFVSGKVDVYASYENPLKYFGRDASIFAEGFIREGRQGATLELAKIRRKSLFDPLAHRVAASVSYFELTDPSYVYPYTYQEGQTTKGVLSFSINPKSDLFSTSLAFSYDRSLYWTDFRFEKTKTALAIAPAIRFSFPFKPSLRFFLGYSGMDPPLQERFNLAGANQLIKERSFWLRSVGAFPKDIYNNFHVAGDANLRGYYDGTFAFKRIVAGNVELQIPFPLPVSRSVSRKLDRRLYVFYDWGRVLDEEPLEGLPPSARSGFTKGDFNNYLSDAGIGVRIWKISAELPLYLSHPYIVGEKDAWDFRWTIGFNRLF